MLQRSRLAVFMLSCNIGHKLLMICDSCGSKLPLLLCYRPGHGQGPMFTEPSSVHPAGSLRR